MRLPELAVLTEKIDANRLVLEGRLRVGCHAGNQFHPGLTVRTTVVTCSLGVG
jgi:hypothetical protein